MMFPLKPATLEGLKFAVHTGDIKTEVLHVTTPTPTLTKTTLCLHCAYTVPTRLFVVLRVRT